MESNKLTVEEFARKNIGKSFKTFDKDYIIPFETEAMIVGYSSFNYSYFYMIHTELIAKNLL
jgi:hypothetical protein